MIHSTKIQRRTFCKRIVGVLGHGKFDHATDNPICYYDLVASRQPTPIAVWQPRFVILKVAANRCADVVSWPDGEGNVSVIAIRSPTIFHFVDDESMRVLGVASHFDSISVGKNDQWEAAAFAT